MDRNNDWRKTLHLETPRAPSTPPDMAPEVVVALTVLAHPDPDWVGGRALLRDLGAGRSVEISRLGPPFLLSGGEARPLADLFLSRRPWRLEPGAGDRLRLDPGAVDLEIDGHEVTSVRELTAAELERGLVITLARRVALLLHTCSALPRSALPDCGLVGTSNSMDQLRQEILRAATSTVPVLVRGETGTGKELVARALHEHSARRAGPWVALNMAAIPPHLAAAELFGAERGAFTGATARRDGYFQKASGGTLFLDEIGETSLEVQALLLRVLENGEVQPVGGGRPQRTDVRVVAATDADLEAKIGEGSFRAPLLHRLAGYDIAVPPLRQRRDDLGLLLYGFLKEELRILGDGSRLMPPAKNAEPWIGAPLVARLTIRPWPGNVRELRNMARQIVATNPGPEPAKLSTSVLPTVALTKGVFATSPEAAARRRKPSEITDREILVALEAEHWDRKATANRLGISRPALYLRLDSIPGVRKAADLSREEILQLRARHGDDLGAISAAARVSAAGLEQRMRKLRL